VKTKRRHWFGKLIRLEEPSPFRTEPECPHFGVCGGCAFQNLQYENQLELKENYLTRTLLKIGRLSLDEVEREAIVPSPSVYFYRNKMEYAFVGSAGDISLGLRERASPLERYKKGTVSLRVCPIFSRTVEPLFQVFRDFANSTGLAAYDPLTRHGFFRNLVLREAKGTGDMLAVLVTRSGKQLEAKDLGERIQAAVPQVKSLWGVENDRVSDVVDYTGKNHILGEKTIEENLHGLALKIYPESFFQPNPGCAADLYGRIVRETQSWSTRRALGLYCGSGSIELALGRTVVEAVGIDSEPMNIRAAEENSRLNSIQNCRFIEGRVEDILKPTVFQGFDLLILDPPRAGISPKGMRHILALSIPYIIYVSCNPGAFARDVRLLTDRGYHLRKLGAFDFFPHTPHLETLGILSR
jgi:23S rRNA (uracil1939-C5)-methyltransferase